MALAGLTVSPGIFALLEHWDRRVVRLGFAYVPHQWSQALAILAINAHHLWLPLLLYAGIAQTRLELRTERGRRRFILAVDAGVVVLVAYVWALPIGVSVGAYGTRMLRAMLPAGPIELAAYALAMSVYLRARREQILYVDEGRLRARRPAFQRAAGVTLLSGALLAVAALVETFA